VISSALLSCLPQDGVPANSRSRGWQRAGEVRARMAACSTAPLFTIDLLAKDLDYLLESGADLPGATANRALFERAREAGLGSRNVSGLAAMYA
jgi:3-hydroxyisobutyrate dehydrogenase-like beta-hydroxyacid dehydrogenase